MLLRTVPQVASTHLPKALDDPEDNEERRTVSDRYGGEESQHRRHQHPNPINHLAPNHLPKAAPKQVGNDVPIEEGAQNEALFLLIPSKLTILRLETQRHCYISNFLHQSGLTSK